MSKMPYMKPFEHAQIKTGKASKDFLNNFGDAFKNRTNKPGHTHIVYKDGKKIETNRQ